MVEIIVCVKGCCDKEMNRLFSVRLVNSGKTDKIKSQQEELGLGTQGDFLTVGLHRWTRLPEITWVLQVLLWARTWTWGHRCHTRWSGTARMGKGKAKALKIHKTPRFSDSSVFIILKTFFLSF